MPESNTLIIGANGTIGSALTNAYKNEGNVVTLSRNDTDYQEDNLAAISQSMRGQYSFDQILCCIGTLHDKTVQPEKNLQHINTASLQHYFYINSILPALVLKYFTPLLHKTEISRFAFLSAMVGSTTDNKLGGWYGYRASKAALNSLIKSASIELKRTHNHSVLVAIHPGTTIGTLTAPFAKNIAPEKYYTPETTAQRIQHLLNHIQPSDSGRFFNWDGSQLPW